jgi:hypothetical protein
MLRLDHFDVDTEDSRALVTSITDDNTITSDGYIYLNGELNPNTSLHRSARSIRMIATVL